MRGFTLIELTISLAILAIILTAALPTFREIQDRHATDTSTRQMKRTLMHARIWALENEKMATLCPMNDNICQSDWTQPLTIFEDKNRNLIKDENEYLAYKLYNHAPRGIWLKKRQAENYIKFDEKGHAFSSATTFIYCPNSQENKHARQVVLSFQGRIRSDHYLSSRGTPYASLGDLNCP